jgi:regulator of sigma E protease
MLTFIVFVVVFGGMIFLHEFGHFIVARLFKIPVEEFGFGIPPRAFRLWRTKGRIVIGGQTVTIPINFDLPFDWQDGLYEEAIATVDQTDNQQLVLRSIELVRTEKMYKDTPVEGENRDELTLKSEYLPSEASQTATPSKPAKETPAGAIVLKGVLSDVEPGMEITINALPLGGFVRPRGENDPSVPGGLAAANPWKRLGVLFAGPLMNLLTAVVVFAIITAQAGIPMPGKVKIEEVTANSPAQEAGLRMGDIVLSINGSPISEPGQMITIIRKNLDKPTEMLVDRNGQQLTIVATPLSSRPATQGALGVAMGYPTRPATWGETIIGGFMLTGIQAVGLASLPIALLRGEISPDQARFVGLKGIYDFFGVAIQRDTESRATTPPPPTNSEPATGNTTPAPQQPTNYVLALIALLSVSLGVFNLMPIPALDGGRILFTLPEILFRRRIPTRLENTVNGVAFLALIGLMLFVNLMDFINPADIKLP